MTRYRIVQVTKNDFAPGDTKVTSSVVWEGTDIRELSMKHPPSQVFGADDLGHHEIEDGFVRWDSHFEKLVNEQWVRCDDPRIRGLNREFADLEDAIDEENRRMFPGDYMNEYDDGDHEDAYGWDNEPDYNDPRYADDPDDYSDDDWLEFSHSPQIIAELEIQAEEEWEHDSPQIRKEELLRRNEDLEGTLDDLPVSFYDYLTEEELETSQMLTEIERRDWEEVLDSYRDPWNRTEQIDRELDLQGAEELRERDLEWEAAGFAYHMMGRLNELRYDMTCYLELQKLEDEYREACNLEQDRLDQEEGERLYQADKLTWSWWRRAKEFVLDHYHDTRFRIYRLLRNRH